MKGHPILDRRHFLKHVALFGAATALPFRSLLADSPLTPKPMGDGLFVVRYGEEIRPASRTPRKITIPNAGEFQVLKGDFHMHTIYSDGAVQPVARVQEAVDNGLDVIAITDHVESSGSRGLPKELDRNTSYNLAKPEAEKQKLILVQGTEITKSEWHFNALFIKDANPIGACGDDWRKMLAVSVEQGGFNHWNHPNWIDRTPDAAPFGLKTGEPMRFHDEIEDVRQKGLLHGVEVFNGISHFPIALDWCNERDLAPIANTDIHASDWNTYGHHNLLRPMTLILAKDRSYESVREAFFAKRTVGWAANMILGRQPWVEKLFLACVTMTAKSGILELVNKSDIPCLVQAGDASHELPALGSISVPRTDNLKKLTISNWLVGMNQPLEITLG